MLGASLVLSSGQNGEYPGNQQECWLGMTVHWQHPAPRASEKGCDPPAAPAHLMGWGDRPAAPCDNRLQFHVLYNAASKRWARCNKAWATKSRNLTIAGVQEKLDLFPHAPPVPGTRGLGSCLRCMPCVNIAAALKPAGHDCLQTQQISICLHHQAVAVNPNSFTGNPGVTNQLSLLCTRHAAINHKIIVFTRAEDLKLPSPSSGRVRPLDKTK